MKERPLVVGDPDRAAVDEPVGDVDLGRDRLIDLARCRINPMERRRIGVIHPQPVADPLPIDRSAEARVEGLDAPARGIEKRHPGAAGGPVGAADAGRLATAFAAACGDALGRNANAPPSAATTIATATRATPPTSRTARSRLHCRARRTRRPNPRGTRLEATTPTARIGSARPLSRKDRGST